MTRLAWLSGLLALSASFASAQQASSAPLDRLVARLDQARPFVGQPIAYTVEIYDAGYATGRVYTPPSFIGFGQQPQPVPSARPVLLDGQSYTLLSQTTLLYPLYAGLVTLEAARLDVPGDGQRPPLSLRSESFTVDVRPLPPDAPPSFRNAIGAFSLQASLSRAEILVGAEVSLSLVIQGVGNLERLLPPDLPLPTGWRAVLSDQNLEMTDLYGGRKTFTWTLYPDPSSFGPVTLPPILMTSFNPRTERYETRSSDALSLNIVGQPPNATTPAPSRASATPALLSFPPLPEPEALPKASAPPWLALLAPPPLLFSLLVLLTRRRPSTSPTAPRLARPVAARQRLQAARALPPLQACAEAAEVLQALQADPAFDGWPEAAKRRLMALLKAAQAAPYAPLTSTDSASLVEEALALLDALRRAASASSQEKRP